LVFPISSSLLLYTQGSISSKQTAHSTIQEAFSISDDLPASIIPLLKRESPVLVNTASTGMPIENFSRSFARNSSGVRSPRDFVTLLNRAEYAVKEGNLESQKEFLKKIGSNFILLRRTSF